MDMPFMNHAPVQVISALNGYNFKGIFDHLLRVRDQMKVMVPTAVFNQFLEDTLLRNPPTSKGTRRFKVFYGTMKHNPPPKFLLFVNSKKLCPTNYLQFSKTIRDAFSLSRLPISWNCVRSVEDSNAYGKLLPVPQRARAEWISASNDASNAVELRKV